MSRPVKFVTHVALYCRDLARSVDWYQRVLGMRVVAASPGRFSALSFGEKHHDIALVQAAPEFRDPDGPRVGLYHISVDTGGFEESLAVYERARALDSPLVKAIDHRLGKGIYVRDPDGNVIELWSESYPSYAEAIATLPHLNPSFEENPIGYPIDVDRELRQRGREPR